MFNHHWQPVVSDRQNMRSSAWYSGAAASSSWCVLRSFSKSHKTSHSLVHAEHTWFVLSFSFFNQLVYNMEKAIVCAKVRRELGSGEEKIGGWGEDQRTSFLNNILVKHNTDYRIQIIDYSWFRLYSLFDICGYANQGIAWWQWATDPARPNSSLRNCIFGVVHTITSINNTVKKNSSTTNHQI
jgi:hypothetical protein